MIHTGKLALDYLAKEIEKQDPGESSHWRKYHSRFRFNGEGFEGLQGFGGNQKPYNGIRYVAHRLFQRRFRNMAREYPEFERIDAIASRITAKQDRAYDLDVLRQAITLAYLHEEIRSKRIKEEPLTCVIGDGFASMTSLLIAAGVAHKVVLVNLTKTLLVDLWYLRLGLGEEKFESCVHLVTNDQGMAQALSDSGSGNDHHAQIIALQATKHGLLRKAPLDLAINIASMQEMDTSTIESYFQDLRASSDSRNLAFYCCNREEKVLPDGTVTRFNDYPWQESDRVVMDELCPWHQHYYTIKPPFLRAYDGPIRHRLAIF